MLLKKSIKSYFLLSFICFLFFLVGCTQDQSIGSLSLTINNSDESTHDILLKKSSDETKTITNSNTNNLLIDELSTGSWSVSIIAKKSTNDNAGEGNATVTIYEKKVTYCEITINPSNPINPYNSELPIGIPDPQFGINESVESIFGSNDYYTYYIDNTHPNATDTNNSHGSATVPRLTLPNLTTLTAGDVVEIHGTINTGSTYYFESDGTASHPIFIRGKAGSEPVIRAMFRVRCKYIIIENLIFDQNQEQRPSILISPASSSHPIDHITVRNNEIRYYQQTTNTGGHSTATAVSDGGSGEYPHHILFYRNYIHDNGNSEGGRDVHGILVGASQYVWILENEMYNNAGDSVQVTTGVDPANSTETPTNHIYIGRNEMHGEHENAVDLKRSTDVVVSENIMHDFWDTYGTWGGGAIVIHQGGYSPISPLRILVIHNHIYNCENNAITTTESDVEEVYIVGNVIHNIGLTTDNSWTYAIIIWATGSHYLYDNIIYNSCAGIGIDTSYGSASDPRNSTDIRNNIIAEIKGNSGTLAYHLANFDASTDSRTLNTTIDNNLFFNSDNTYLFYWNYQQRIGLSAFQSATNQGYYCDTDNPLFSNANSNDFHILNGSPAIDSGVDISSVLEDNFGFTYSTDYDGNPKSVGSWDIGPYEYQ